MHSLLHRELAKAMQPRELERDARYGARSRGGDRRPARRRRHLSDVPVLPPPRARVRRLLHLGGR